MSETKSVEDLFGELIELDTARECAEFLNGNCSDDQDLRRQLEELYEAHAAAGSFLDATETLDTSTENEAIPEREIGPYKLLQKLGEGGMGVVYLAERQRPVKQRVALKIVKLGMDTKQFVARFEAERQALAMMDHPNIAKVLDAGCTESGRPYFVMELIKGVPISDFCDENRLTTRERLQLFMQVCQAVHHAHQKGIIHRDIKPSNVLVALYDDNPVPKVIDFGVAKATNQQLTEKTLFTEVGSILGTWEYMSPEQAVLNQLDVDTRTDVYSLGVLLYELLTGETPLDRRRLREAQIMETLRMIREDEPPKPSTRVSSLGEQASTMATYRRAKPKSLASEIRGDLDWIVMKSLAKERVRRYDSANRFAEDVERYLNHEMVEARPPSLAYQLGKFVQRYRALSTSVAIVFAALSLGIVVALWGLQQATQTARQLQHEQEASRALMEKLLWESRERVYLVAMSGDATLTEQAIENFRKTVGDEKIPDGWVEFVQGVKAFEATDFAEAKDHLERSLNKRKTIATEALLAHCQTMTGDFISFAKAVDKLGKLSPEEPDDAVFLARILLWSGAFGDAKNVLDSKSVSTSILARLARLSIDKTLAERRGDATGVAEKANEFDQMRKLMHNNLRLRSWTIGAHSAAHRLFKRHGRDSEANRHRNQIGRIEREIADSNSDYQSHVELASFFEEVLELDQAETHWARAVKKGMVKHKQHGEYVFYLLRRGKWQEARELSKNLPSSHAFVRTLSLLTRDGGSKSAVEYVNAPVNRLPQFPILGVMSSACVYLCGEDKVAQEMAGAFSTSDVAKFENHAGHKMILDYLRHESDDATKLLSELPDDRFADGRIYSAMRLIGSGDPTKRRVAKEYLTEAHANSKAYWERTVSWTLLELLKHEEWPAHSVRE